MPSIPQVQYSVLYHTLTCYYTVPGAIQVVHCVKLLDVIRRFHHYTCISIYRAQNIHDRSFKLATFVNVVGTTSQVVSLPNIQLPEIYHSEELPADLYNFN